MAFIRFGEDIDTPHYTPRPGRKSGYATHYGILFNCPHQGLEFASEWRVGYIAGNTRYILVLLVEIK